MKKKKTSGCVRTVRISGVQLWLYRWLIGWIGAEEEKDRSDKGDYTYKANLARSRVCWQEVSRPL